VFGGGGHPNNALISLGGAVPTRDDPPNRTSSTVPAGLLRQRDNHVVGFDYLLSFSVIETSLKIVERKSSNEGNLLTSVTRPSPVPSNPIPVSQQNVERRTAKPSFTIK
jgi:hypothetical protein